MSEYSVVTELGLYLHSSYDPVAKVMLHSPHRIGDIDVTVTAGDRYPPKTVRRKEKPTPAASKTSVDVTVKKADLKPEPGAHVPRKVYCVHITGLPLNIDAETLSDEFNWNIFDIVMDPCVNGRLTSTQCWLKNPRNEREVDDFVQDWNQVRIGNSTLTCVKQEDEPELCDRYQSGRCTQGGNCYWVHEPCTANGTCSESCPYGHVRGEKPENYRSNRK